jgi:uncharacterized protein
MDSKNVAHKILIKDLLQGTYVRTEGQFEPNYLKVGELNISRVNVIAVVVSSEDAGLVLDDGSGRIEARVMAGSDIKLPAAGTAALVIGRPREFNDSIYLVPEIIKTVSPGWLEHRKLELQTQSISKPEKVLQIIKSLDKGDGADIDEVVKRSQLPECEKIINLLLSEGDIFQVKHGRLKALE